MKRYLILLVICVSFGNLLSAQNYCTAVSSHPWEYWIAQFTLNDLDNPSGKCHNWSCGYSDFTDLKTDLKMGGDYHIEVSPGFSFFHMDLFFRVWIDYNQDGDFEDENEVVYSIIVPQGINGQAGNVEVGTIQIPEDIPTGETRLRVSMNWFYYPDACENVERGEIEDYTVNILPAPAPKADLKLQVEGVPTAALVDDKVDLFFSLSNNGPHVAENISAILPLISAMGGMAVESIDELDGEFYFASQTWKLDQLAPGETARFNLRVGIMNVEEIHLYGQITGSSLPDPDSTPGNGTDMQANEDDEFYEMITVVPISAPNDGCYFEETYAQIDNDQIKNRQISCAEDQNGIIHLQLYEEYDGFTFKLKRWELSSTGTLLSNDFDKSIPGLHFPTEKGYIGTTTANADQIAIQHTGFDGAQIWEATLIVPGAKHIKINHGQEKTNGYFVLTGRVQLEGMPGFYPAVFLLNAAGGVIGQSLLEPVSVSINLYVKYISSTGIYCSLYDSALGVRHLIKLDHNLNLLWNYALSNDELLGEVAEDQNGHCYVLAKTEHLRVIKLDQQGQEVWSKVHHISLEEQLDMTSILAVDDGVIFTYAAHKIADATTITYVKKVDFDYGAMWDFGKWEVSARIAFVSDDGGLIFAGVSEYYNEPSTPDHPAPVIKPFPYLMRTTSDGQLSPPCSPTMNLNTDLHVSNLNAPATALGNELLEYTFDLSNLGTAVALGDFNIRTYFSTDEVLSADDVFDGLIPTGYIGGQVNIQSVSGASMVPDLPQGDYYLLIKVDADEDIAEWNEGNNVISSPIGINLDPEEFCDIESEFPWHEWIANVEFGQQLTNKTLKATYNDYSHLGPVVAERGGTLPFNFVAMFSYFTYQETFSWHIDFNGNGVFEDKESFSSTFPAILPGHLVAFSKPGIIEIPEDAKLGPTKVRIILRRGQLADPCADIAFGEVEDYEIFIEEAGSQSPRLQNIDSAITVFPNPADEEISVLLKDSRATHIMLYDVLGQSVLVEEIDQTSIHEIIKINTSQLSAGTYFISLEGSEQRAHIEKIVLR